MAIVDDTKALIQAFDPESVTILEFWDNVDVLIGLAQDYISATAYGLRYTNALALQVLHWEYLRRRSGASTEVIGLSEGPARREYSRPQKTTDPDDLSLTQWGLRLKTLRASLPTSIMVNAVTLCYP